MRRRTLAAVAAIFPVLCPACFYNQPEPDSTKSILSFTIENPPVPGIIDEQDRTITITLPEGIDVTSLTPLIEHSGVSISPESGQAKDFSNPVAYTVLAEDTSTSVYSARVVPAPDAPSNLSATTGLSSAEIDLTWDDNSSIERGFRIERKVNNRGEFQEIALTTPDSTDYRDLGLVAGMTYQYRVCARLADIDSAYAAQAEATTPAATAGISIYGKVYYSTTAMNGVFVELAPDAYDDPIIANVITGNDGSYHFDGVVSGYYHIILNAPTPEYWAWIAHGASFVNASFEYDLYLKKHLGLEEPADGASVPASPTLRWEDFPGAAEYSLQVNETMTWELIGTFNNIGTNEFRLGATLKDATQYSWMVTALDSSDHEIAYSIQSSFIFDE